MNNFGVAPEEKAGYNQAARITELLSMLRTTYISAIMDEDFDLALKSCRGVKSIIAGKVKTEEIKDINTKIKVIDDVLPLALETYVNRDNSSVYYRRNTLRKLVRQRIEVLWEQLERIQDKYGYGMKSEEDYGL